jgi:mRNA-degrading endonuclease RelE of RelBE toxin-antitoxin system
MLRFIPLGKTKTPFAFFIPKSVGKLLSDAKKKDKELARQIEKRLKKLCSEPECGKPLSHDKAGDREVHLKDHWVIRYRIDYDKNRIVVVDFGLHEYVLGR